MRRCGLRIAWLLPNARTNLVALQPLWAARCLRRIRQPRLFACLAVRAPLWAAHCRDCSPCAETFVAVQCARCCGLRVVFVASDRPSILFPLRRARTPLWAARCLHRIRQPKHFVCIAVLHPTAQDLRCLAMHDFFSIGLLVSYRFMLFFIDWKLPPPACPGTTGIIFTYMDVFFYNGINLGKYTNRPMDPVGLPLDKNSSRPSKNPPKGHLTIPKRSQRIARYGIFTYIDPIKINHSCR